MLWVGWRQTRSAAAGAIAVTSVLGIYLLATGLRLHHAYISTGLADCVTGDRSTPACTAAQLAFYSVRNSIAGTGGAFVAYLNVLPGLLGVFIGAPVLAREYEQGTHRLLWTQSVSRTRWLTWRLLVAGVTVVVAELIVTAAMTYWRVPQNHLDGRFAPDSFGFEGIVPIGYTLFAFALGVAAGALLRRTAAAMAATIGVFLVVRTVVESWARPRYLAAKVMSFVGRPPADVPSSHHGDWMLSMGIPRPGSGFPTILTYQPAARYWLFQGIETAIYLLPAASLIAYTFWRARRNTNG